MSKRKKIVGRTIKEIIEVSANIVIQKMGRNYEASKVWDIADTPKSYYFLITPKGKGTPSVPCTWTEQDDLKNTEEGRISIAGQLIVNGVHSLDDLLEYMLKEYYENPLVHGRASKKRQKHSS